MKVAIIGGSGFVGTNLIKALKENHDVTNIDIATSIERTNFIKCNITDEEAVNKIFKNELKDTDVVVHLAALSRETISNKEPVLYFKVNVNGTFNVLNACLDTNIKNFVFASSYLVYGNSNEEKVNETHQLQPKSVYAATKVCGEAIANSFNHIYGINTVSLRKCVIYGENDPQKRVVNLFIDAAKESKDITVFGDKILDFLYIGDAVNAYINAINYKKTDTFNIGSGKGYSLREIAEIIKSKMNSKSKILQLEPREGEVTRFIADITKAREKLKFIPNGNLMDFIERQCLKNVSK